MSLDAGVGRESPFDRWRRADDAERDDRERALGRVVTIPWYADDDHEFALVDPTDGGVIWARADDVVATER
jgi:hypothetical protein